MTTHNEVAPWTSVTPRIFAYWDARGESAEQISTRVAATLTAIDQAMGGGTAWEELHSENPLDPASLSDLEQLVATFVYRDDRNTAFPDNGYILTLLGRKGHDAVTVSLFVGSGVTNHHRASNKVAISFARYPRTVTMMDSLLIAIATHWQPAAAAAIDTDTIVLTGGRGYFAPTIGQRTWLRSDLGPITTAPDGVTISPIAGGTLLTADDSWSPQQVIDAMTATLSDNTITTIPRGPQP